MSTSMQTFSPRYSLRPLLFAAVALGAGMALAAPTFKDIKLLPLVTESPAAAPVDPAVKKEFNEALATCRSLARENKTTDAAAAFQVQVKAQTDDALRMQALEAYALFLYNDRERNFEEQAVAAFDQLLTSRGALTSKVKSWLQLKQAVLSRQKQHAASYETARALLALPELSEADKSNYKSQAIDGLANAERVEDAITLCREVAQDANEPTSLRWRLGRRGADLLLRQLEKTDEASTLLDELLKLPLDASQRATLQQDLIYLVMHAIKPRDLDAVETRSLALINDTNAPAQFRGRAALGLLNIFYGERELEQKARPVPVAGQLLTERVLPVGEEVRLRESLQRTLARLGRDEAALEQARLILANTNAPTGSRVSACASLTEPSIQRGDYADAEKQLRATFNFPDLTTQVAEQIVERIGRIYLLQEQVDRALAIYREAYKLFKTPDMTNRVTKLSAEALMEVLRFEEAAKLWFDQDNPLEAAAVYGSPHFPFEEQARELRLQVLEDESRSLKERASAYQSFLTHEPKDVPVAITYRDLFIQANTNWAISTFVNMITANGRGTAYFGDFAGSVRYLEWVKPLVSPNLNFKTTLNGIHAYAGLGRLDEAAALARDSLVYVDFSPQEIYQMKMTVAALALRDPKASVQAGTAALTKADASAVKELPMSPAERATALAAVGAIVLQGNLETAARAVDTLRESLCVPELRKRYTVTYSEQPITGIDAWNVVAPKTERQKMDRKYGDNLEFLATDVATGDRGEGIGADKNATPENYTELSLICDVNGVHFRFDATDDRTHEIAAKLLGGGSYEGYIAPGPNQPYICFLVNIQSGKIGFYNTTYNNQNHKRVRDEDVTLWSGEHRFTDKGYTTYIFLSWDAYADKIPEIGELWDFENVQWGRAGSYTWNGLKSIHGRSSWGELAFDIPAKARIDIKRKLIFDALARYKDEKRTSHHHEGVIDHWQDAAVGDPAFYAACVKPLAERLDSFIPLVKTDMPDADVDRVFNEAVFGWNNIGHLAADLRRRYLAAALVQ